MFNTTRALNKLMGTEKLRKSPTINFSSLPLAAKEFRQCNHL